MSWEFQKSLIGWLEKLQTYHNVVFKPICGEAKSVDVIAVLNSKERLQSVYEGYEDKHLNSTR